MLFNKIARVNTESLVCENLFYDTRDLWSQEFITIVDVHRSVKYMLPNAIEIILHSACDQNWQTTGHVFSTFNRRHDCVFQFVFIEENSEVNDVNALKSPANN
jgi:hypothetical protein